MRENFTNSEINHVSVINRQLTTLQNWLNTCTESALEYCNPDNGTANIDFDDYEMDIVFKFSLGESDESFNAVNEYDNRIAVISKRAKPMLGPDMDAINWNEHIPMI